MNEKGAVLLYYGHFDPPTASDIVTIQRLARRFRIVYVLVDDQGYSKHTTSYRMAVLEDAFSHLCPQVMFSTTEENFLRIDRGLMGKFTYDTFGCTDLDILRHMESIGVDTVYVEQAYPTVTPQRMMVG
jgi:hypothetical protein